MKVFTFEPDSEEIWGDLQSSFECLKMNNSRMDEITHQGMSYMKQTDLTHA